MIPDSSFKVLSDMAYNIEKSKAESNGHLQIIEGSQIIDIIINLFYGIRG